MSDKVPAKKPPPKAVTRAKTTGQVQGAVAGGGLVFLFFAYKWLLLLGILGIVGFKGAQIYFRHKKRKELKEEG